MIKYRVHEVAKDFKLNSKDIAEIMTKYCTTPKNHMQVLTDLELAIIFDYITQHNQIDSIESVFADVYHEPKAEPAPKAETAAPKAEAGTPKDAAAPKAEQPAKPKAEQPAAPTTRVPEKKVVDTRKGGNVNLDKYDERLENFTDQRQQDRGGKQKFQNRNNKGRQQGSFGNKRKQEEAEKMRRLQLEIAKKTPLTVKIPDEIGVGELASRMKKTGAEVVKCLMKNGVMASLSEIIDFDTAAFVAEELGCKVEKEVIVTNEEKLIDVS